MKNRKPRAIGAAVILATGVGIQAFPAASRRTMLASAALTPCTGHRE